MGNCSESKQTADQLNLSAWVSHQHRGQIIKKSGELYFYHLLRVASMAGKYIRLGYEVGLCHDLLEDTSVQPDELYLRLSSFGYNDSDTKRIVQAVEELTDVYTKAAYPFLNKPLRKNLEAERLCTISPLAQTIKYADLSDNLTWMLRYDYKHVRDYSKKKYKLLKRLNQGDQELHKAILKRFNMSRVSSEDPL